VANRPPPIWQDIYPVRSYDVDARGRLSVIAICNFLQDAAGCHAHALGVSIDQLHPLHLTWILVRMRLELVDDLAWQDRMIIQTWPSHQERLISQRDFLLSDGGGREVGRCVTSWVVMDLQRWRPQRLTSLPEPLPVPECPRALATLPAKLDAPEAVAHEQVFRVGDRDLDRNGHVNNVRYVEWALETVPVHVLNTCRLEALDINFTGEAFHAEDITAASQPADGQQPIFRHVIRRQTTGDDLARAKTVWQPLP
jgi:medium-chain acyl-[acyl-carrier-protein] hydrolase